MAWDATYEASPTEGDLVGGGNEAMQGIKTDVRTRVAKEHQFDLTEAGGQPLQGLHRAGSAKAYYAASSPTTRPDGTTALTSDDAGRLMVDSSTLEPKVYTGSAWSKLKVTLASILALGTNWATALAATLGSGWTTALSAALGSGWATALAATYEAPTASTGPYAIPGYGFWNYNSSTGLGNDIATVTATSYTKVMSFKCPVTGTINVNFRMLSHDASTTAYGRVYKDGSAFGTERSTAAGTSQFYSESLAVTKGEVIQLYCKTSSASEPCHVVGFALCVNGYGLYCF